MLVLLSGVSGAGKDTVKKELIKRNERITSLPSYTDRAPRAGEVNGEIYNFISTEEFEELIKNGDLYEFDAHHDHYYGTSRKLLNERLRSGKIIVKDMDVNGTENLVKLLGQDTKIITIFLRVPKNELHRRLLARNPEITEDEIKKRLSRFEYEESKIDFYDYVLKNNDLEKTIQIISTIIEAEEKVAKPEF